VIVATEGERRDAIRGQVVASEVAALADAHERGGGWDVEGRESDLARCCAFVERHTPRLTGYLFERPLGVKWSPLLRTVQGLGVGARVLQCLGGRAKNRMELIGALFAEASDPAGDADDDIDSWQSTRRALARIRRASDGRPSWVEVLLDQAAARQGGSALVHAVDIARLGPALDDVLSRWQLDLQDPFNNPAQRRSLPAQALTDPATIESLRRLDTAVAQEVVRVGKWSALIERHFPAEYDPSAYGKRFASALDALLKSTVGGLSHPEARKIKTLLEALGQVPLRAALLEATHVKRDTPRADLLWRLGRISGDVRRASEGFIEYAEPIVFRVEQQVRERGSATGDPQAEAVHALGTEVTQLAVALEEAQP
jgi:hypothetical protein